MLLQCHWGVNVGLQAAEHLPLLGGGDHGDETPRLEGIILPDIVLPEPSKEIRTGHSLPVNCLQILLHRRREILPQPIVGAELERMTSDRTLAVGETPAIPDKVVLAKKIVDELIGSEINNEIIVRSMSAGKVN